MFTDINSGYGQLAAYVAGSGIPTFGRLLVVMPSTDPNYNPTTGTFRDDEEGRVRMHTTLESAYAEAESGRNDVILLSANATHLLADMLTVAKKSVNFLGLDGGDRLIQQGAKIALATASTAVAATMTVTGNRNSFRNIKFINEGTDASSVAAVIGHGDEGTLWKNCSFQKLSDLGEAAVSDFEIRSDSATFLDCEFGFDTLLQTATRPTLWIKASGATRMKDCRFRGCTFISANSSADKLHVDLENTSSLVFDSILENCNFINSIVSSTAAIQATVAVASTAGSVEGTLHFINPYSNAASFCTTSDQFLVGGPEKAVAATTGLAVTPA